MTAVRSLWMKKCPLMLVIPKKNRHSTARKPPVSRCTVRLRTVFHSIPRYRAEMVTRYRIPPRHRSFMKPTSEDTPYLSSTTVPMISVPAGASFAVRVSGDSMEPVLHDGQYAWVEECTRLNPGEVGLFVVDGEGFIKVYDEQEPEGDDAEDFTDSEGIRHPQPVLVSCNEDYAPKVIGAGMNFRIVGRVLNA